MNKPRFEFTARNIRTDQTLVFRGSTQMREHGFNPTRVYEVSDGKRLHHRGWTFTKSQIKNEE